MPRKNRFLRVALDVAGERRPRAQTVPPAAPAHPALSAADAIAAIGARATRDAIGDTIVDYLRSAFGVGVVTIVRDGAAIGWKGFAPGSSRELVEAVHVPLGAPSCFAVAADNHTIFRGAPPEAGAMLQAAFWRALHVAPPHEVLVCPIVLRERVVNLVYAHALDGGTLPEASAADLQAVCAAAAAAFARLIQTGKAR